MQGVTGGSLPSVIWRRFVTAAMPIMKQAAEQAAALSQESSAVTGALTTPATAATEAPAQPRCNQQACAARYSSFRASDCTYKSFYGRRRICGEGIDELTAEKPSQIQPTAATLLRAIIVRSRPLLPEVQVLRCGHLHLSAQ